MIQSCNWLRPLRWIKCVCVCVCVCMCVCLRIAGLLVEVRAPIPLTWPSFAAASGTRGSALRSLPGPSYPG